ncbi:MAG: ATP-binding protein [Bacilli bacterium]|nr:ATP-binding protein [Bacilli bacterium]
MHYWFEIYLTKKDITKEEWSKLIKVISNYNRSFRKWKIIIQIDGNQIRYFVKSRCNLPPTINNLNSFLLKSSTKIDKLSYSSYSLFFSKPDYNIIDIINDASIKNKGDLKYIEIIFKKLYEDKIKAKTNIYLKKNEEIKKYRALFILPASLLTIDFNLNKRYLVKSANKYLDINKILHLLNSDQNATLLKVDTFPYLQGDFYIKQNSYNFNKHSLIIGSSGSGKSKFLSLLIKNVHDYLKEDYKIVVIDPHADLENDIGGLGKIIDFKSDLDSIDLFVKDNDNIIATTELLLELFKSLIADQYNSKLERVLRHSIYLLLVNNSFNFSNLRRLIIDLEYRNSIIKNLKLKLPMSVIDFFLSDFSNLKTTSYSTAISPIIAFIDEMEMVPVFNGQKDFPDLKTTVSENFLTLFSLDRTLLGDKITKTIAGLIMQQLLTIIQKREISEHIIFVIDEVAVIENPILARFLSEARKYNLSLILAGQFFSQISNYLKNSIFANVANYYVFRVSKLDADLLVDSFNMKIPLDDTRERKVKLLTELNTRECIARIDYNGVLLPAFKGTTLNYESVPRIKDYVIKNNENNLDNKKKKCNFKIDNTVSLKDILILTSSSRKVVK